MLKWVNVNYILIKQLPKKKKIGSNSEEFRRMMKNNRVKAGVSAVKA